MIAEPAAPATGGPNIASERSTRRDDPADAYGNLTFRAFPLIRKRPTNIDPIFKIQAEGKCVNLRELRNHVPNAILGSVRDIFALIEEVEERIGPVRVSSFAL